MANPPPLIIKEWNSGIGDSPNVGIGLLRNASIDAESGALVPAYLPAKVSPVSSSSTFTADAASDLCTLTGSFAALASAVAVTLSSTGTLPAGLSPGTNYFIIKKSASTYKLATCIKNCGDLHGTTGFSEVDIDITDSGTGVHTMSTVDVGPIGAQTVVMQSDLFIGFTVTPNVLTFFIDTNGRVWFYDPYDYPNQLMLLDGNSLSGPKGLGIGSFQTSSVNHRYIFTFRSLFMDVCDVSSIIKMADPVGGSAWTTAWQAATGINNGSQHMIVGDDNIMYFCNGTTVGSIQEVPGSVFAPGSSGTYTYNQAALTLPTGEVAYWLEQLGIDLLVGGGSYNNIYPWDRTSVSFDLPIKCAEKGIFRMKNINNTVFIMSGTKGNIYKTQGAIVQPVRQIPTYVAGTGNPNILWGGVGEKNGNLIFGVNALNNSANSGTYMLFPDGRLTIDSQPSSGAGVTTAFGSFGEEFYLQGYNGGVDLISTGRYTGFGAVFQSQLYDVASKIGKRAFSRLEAQITQPTSGSSSVIRISYRRGLSGSFTVLATFTTDGSTTGFTQDIGLTDIENIQIQVEMTGAGNNTDSLQLFQVRLYP